MNRIAGLFVVGALGSGCTELPADAAADGLERRIASSARPLHVVLVLDITNSWSQANFAEARDATAAFLDVVTPDAGPHDLVGLVVTTGRFGVEHTPMVPIRDAAAFGVPEDWAALRTASKAGIAAADVCRVFPYNNSRYTAGVYPPNEFGLSSNTLNDSSWPQDTYTSVAFPPQLPRTTQTEAPEGGCWPNMWREYVDESGTDHSNGLQLAYEMLSEHDDPFVYRAVVVLTDGSPNGTGAHTTRDRVGYVETRWRYLQGPSRTTAEVVATTRDLAARAWRRYDVNTWAVSFVDPAAWLGDVAQGDGTFVQTSTATDLGPIYEGIAGDLRR